MFQVFFIKIRCVHVVYFITFSLRSSESFIVLAVWHQANPITKGVRWALVIFYKVNVFSE